MRKFLFLTLLCTLFFTTNLFGEKNKHAQNMTSHRTILVNGKNVAGKMNGMFKECIGAGRANEGLRADWQQQLAEVKKDCDFKYIRMHGLLTDDMGVYKEDKDGKPMYSFQYVDALYDYLLEIGIKPFVELSFMPNALASGSKTVFWWKGNITPPKDYNKWADLIKALVSHFTERYGAEEVKTWYFEVWNEPNLKDGFWSSTQDEYFKLYKYTAEAVKSINQDYKVGGPATAGAAWVPETIEFCAKNNVPIDFIATHQYGVTQGFLDQYGTAGTILAKNPYSVADCIINSRKEISKSSKPNLELHYTEWSSSYTPADPVHDTYIEAPYILNQIKRTGQAVSSMSYWVFTDIFEEAGPRFTPFHGGFGLMNTQGIKKSAYYAYKFLNQLGDIELQNTDSCSWICKNDKGDIQVLLWNYTFILPDSINNQEFFVRDLPSKSKGSVDIKFTDIPEGSYQLQVYKTGYKVNDAYSSYIEMGSPNQLTKEQVKVLKVNNNAAPISTETIMIDSTKGFVKNLPMRENDVYLVSLKKM